MFNVGDRVYAESRLENGKLVTKGYAVIDCVMDDCAYVLFDGMDILDAVYTTNPNYKYDVIRKLTKLEQALQ